MLDSGMLTRITALNSTGTVWKSLSPEIAKVDSDGIVTAISEGDAVITAESAQGEKAECLVTVGYRGRNPILPPTWGLFIADGEPHAFNGKMYIYGSRDNAFGLDESGHLEFCSSDYHVIYSDDLIHWTDAGVSISVDDFPENLRNISGTNGGKISYLWAPDLFKAPGKEKYFLTFCSAGNQGEYFLADSPRPEGPFENIRPMTYQGKRINRIDPGVLTDDDGRVYMAMPAPFCIGELDPETGYAEVKDGSIISLQELVKESPDGYYGFEGPSLRKFNGKYYFIYIASKLGVVRPVRMNYLISENIRSGWRFGGTIIDTNDYLSGINVHGSIEYFLGKYFISYHRCVPGMGPVSREINLEELHIREDGAIEQARLTSSGAAGAFGKGEKIAAASAVEFSGGRGDERFVHRGQPVPGTKHTWKFEGSAIAAFSAAGQWNLYRFVRLSGCTQVVLRIRTSDSGGELEIREIIDAETKRMLVRGILPDTAGKWQKIDFPLLPAPVTAAAAAEEEILDRETELTVGLRAAPAEGTVELDWFEFV